MPPEILKVFISHSSRDAAIVKHLVDDVLIGSLQIKIGEIKCTSVEGSKINSGKDWRSEILKYIGRAKITLLILTTNYKASEMCLNEMGAAYALPNEVIPVIIDPLNFDNAGVLSEVKQLEILNEESNLDKIYDRIKEILDIPRDELKVERWNSKKRDFIGKVNKYVKDNPFPYPRSDKEITNIMRENVALNSKYDLLHKDYEKLKASNKELIKLKNKEEVDEVLIKEEASKCEALNELIDEVESDMDRFSRAIKKIIFSEYTKKKLPIDWMGDEEDLQLANAKKYIDIWEDDIKIDWDETKEMHKLKGSLDNLSKFITESLTYELAEQYETDNYAPLDLENYTFWEKILF